jgi:hypothetical protein
VNSWLKLAVIALIVCLVVGRAQASLLNLSLNDSPDIFSSFIDVNYNAGSQQFTAQGFALTLHDGVGTQNILNGSFLLTAQIDNSGAMQSGSLLIQGAVAGFGPNLLSGQLDAFGFQPLGGPIFEFLFSVTGGDMAVPSWFGGIGSEFGVILTASGVNFTGNWNLDFSNTGGIPGTGIGFSDTAPVPAPATAIILAGLLGCSRRRRC